MTTMPEAVAMEPKKHWATVAKEKREAKAAESRLAAAIAGPAAPEPAISTSGAPAPAPAPVAEAAAPAVIDTPLAVLDPVEFATRFYASNPTLAMDLAEKTYPNPAATCAGACHATYEAYLLTICPKFRAFYIKTHPEAKEWQVPRPAVMEEMYRAATAS
jgi:hypothetical protein